MISYFESSSHFFGEISIFFEGLVFYVESFGLVFGGFIFFGEINILIHAALNQVHRAIILFPFRRFSEPLFFSEIWLFISEKLIFFGGFIFFGEINIIFVGLFFYVEGFSLIFGGFIFFGGLIIFIGEINILIPLFWGFRPFLGGFIFFGEINIFRVFDFLFRGF